MKNRNRRSKDNMQGIMDYICQHPGTTAAEIAAALHINVQTVRDHAAAMENSGNVRRERSTDNAHEYVFFSTGNTELITFDARNCIVAATTPRKRRNVWTPKGGTLADRINAIVERDRQARLAPEYTR